MCAKYAGRAWAASSKQASRALVKPSTMSQKAAKKLKVAARAEVSLPKVIFGTSSLGNLFSEPTHEEKKAVIAEIVKNCPDGCVFDSAGKYGAGLALEELGKCLEELNVPVDKVGVRRSGRAVSNIALRRSNTLTPRHICTRRSASATS